MRTTDKTKGPPWPGTVQMEKLRQQLRERISHQELDSQWWSDMINRLLPLLQIEPVAFHQVWIEPLLEAGATLEVAVTSIVAAYILPN